MKHRTQQLFALSALSILLLAGCGGDNFNFTQLDGFDDIRAGLPHTPPTAAEQQLLRQHQPVLYVDAAAEGPLDFYHDYIASGVLTIGDTVISSPTADALNRHKHDLAAMFTHTPTPAPVTPVAYGGVSRGDIALPDGSRLTLTFLSYHFVFRTSGLPAGIPPLHRALANIVADSEDWHQLDHYTAAFIALADGEPRAVLLQQHNYMRTYFIGDAHFPDGANIEIDVAQSSNELYPHSDERRVWRSVGFMSPNTIDYLLHLSDDGGLYSGNDITHGQRRVDYTLQFLPPNDAFYVFEGWLGERRSLPGRDGPPGAIYRTLPQFWHPEQSLPVFHWQEQDSAYADLMREELDGWTISDAALAALNARFADAWAARFGD